MTDNNKEIVALEVVESVPTKVMKSPIEMATALIEQKVDPAFVEKMMELQFKHEANEARKAYFDAVTEFKKNPPKILKDKHVSFNKTKYNHATLGNVTETISSELSKHGLSANWKQAQDNGQLTVTCILTHRLGYSESTSLTAGNDTSGGKNTIQAVSSTNSYLCRYTILAITGLATHDMDDDGQSSEVEYLTVDQQTEITDMISQRVYEPKEFAEHWEFKTVAEIPAKNYNKIIASLRSLPNVK